MQERGKEFRYPLIEKRPAQERDNDPMAVSL